MNAPSATAPYTRALRWQVADSVDFTTIRKASMGNRLGLLLLILRGSADAQASAWPLGPAQVAQMHLLESVYSSNGALCINLVKEAEQHFFFFQLLKNREVNQPSVLGSSVYFPSQRIPSCSGKR